MADVLHLSETWHSLLRMIDIDMIEESVPYWAHMSGLNRLVDRLHGSWFRLGWTVIGLASLVYIISSFIGWGSESEDWIGRASSYCEMAHSGIMREPVNTLSNLAYIAVGMFFLYTADRMPKKGPNPFSRRGLAAPTYGMTAILLGIGSFAMHGTSTAISGMLDWSGMLLWIAFPVFYNLSRWFNWNENRLIATFLITVTLLLLIDLAFDSADFSDLGAGDSQIAATVGMGALYRHILWSSAIGMLIIFELGLHTAGRITNLGVRIALVGAAPSLLLVISAGAMPVLLIIVQCLTFVAAATVLCSSSTPNFQRSLSPWLPIGVGAFISGLIIWQFGLQGTAKCNPDTFFQYHAGWHLLTAITVFSLGRYFQTEVELTDESE